MPHSSTGPTIPLDSVVQHQNREFGENEKGPRRVPSKRAFENLRPMGDMRTLLLAYLLHRLGMLGDVYRLDVHLFRRRWPARLHRQAVLRAFEHAGSALDTAKLIDGPFAVGLLNHDGSAWAAALADAAQDANIYIVDDMALKSCGSLFFLHGI